MDAIKVRTEGIPEVQNGQPRAGWVAKLRYTKSFLAKLCLSKRDLKETYCALFNKFASHNGVSAKTSYGGVTFYYKRKPVAKITLAGKTLSVYYAVDPSAYTGRYRLADLSNVKRYAHTPAKYRVKSKGGLRFALRVADDLFRSLSVEQTENPILPPVSAKDFPTDTLSNLLSRGLIRPMGGAKKNTGKRESLIFVEKPVETPVAVKSDEDAETKISDGAENAEITEESAEESTKDESEETTETQGNADNDNAETAAAAPRPTFEQEIFADTAATTVALTNRHEGYGAILNSFLDEGEIRLVKQSVVRSVDESWVTAIEECLPALDEVTRNPSHFIEETEELLPIERTKKVTTRSIKHLCQHTGLISRVENGVVIPSKLLNVFRDESMMTYENKFVNTLISRLYDFVTMRIEEAEEYGANRRKYLFSVSDRMEQDEEKGKVTLTTELSVPTDTKEKNRFFQSDLWARVKKLGSVITDYSSSEFATMMGNAFIRPPVVRTNPILKNKDLRQCLELWEFLEGYEDDEAGVATSEEEIEIGEEQRKLVMQSLAQQYVLFRHFAELATADKASNAPKKEKTEKPSPLEVAEIPSGKEEEKSTDDLTFWVEVALQAEEISLNEWKEEHAALMQEREELLRQEKEEQAEKEEIKSAVDDTPASYPDYEKPTFEPPEAEEKEEEEKGVTETGETVLYVKSFATKLSLAGDTIKSYYCAIANALLAKEGVRERKAFDHVDFVKGRKTLARVTLAGKTLRVYFPALSEELQAKYNLTDRSEVKKFAATPSLLRVRGPRGLKKALDIIALVAEGPDAKKSVREVVAEDYPQKTTEEAIAAGEIRMRILKAATQERLFLERLGMRPEPKREEYDYTEEVAAYKLRKEKKEKKGKELVMEEVTPQEIGEVLEKVNEEALSEIAPSEIPSDIEGAEGDRLLLRNEATPTRITLEGPQDAPAPAPEPEVKPREVQPDGDILKPKPITADALDASISRANQKNASAPAQKKRGVLSRLFRRGRR